MSVNAGWARRVRTIVAPLLVIITAALCAANVRLCVPVVVGCLCALTVWRLRLLVKLAAVIFAAAVPFLVSLLAGCSSSETTLPTPTTWTAHFAVTVTMSGDQWHVRDEMTVSQDTMRQLVEGGGGFTESLPPALPGQLAHDTSVLGDRLGPEWRLDRVVNGSDPVFLRDRPVRTCHIRLVPLVTFCTVDAPRAVYNSVNLLVPDDRSEVTIFTPQHVIDTTDPAGSSALTANGERWRLDDASSNITIGALSPISREQPLRGLAHLSLSGSIAWILGIAWGGLTAFAQEEVKEVLTLATGKRDRREGEPQPDPHGEDAEPTDSGRRPNRSELPRPLMPQHDAPADDL